MSKILPSTTHTNDSWNTYWQGTSDAGALNSGGTSHPAVRKFWDAVFADVNRDYDSPQVLDIASGNGAVIESALAALSSKQSKITSLDISAAAIKNIHLRFPAVTGIVADAANMPMQNSSFDIVTSQFGIEYAGCEAIYEAARLVAKEGRLVLLLHIESGGIHHQCKQNLDAIERLQACQFMPLATQMFSSGFKVVSTAERSAYQKASTQFIPAIRELEAIMKHYGSHIASNTLAQLYKDIRHMHQRIEHYNPDDVLNWLQKMEGELCAYAERMSSMLRSAVSQSSFMQIKSELLARGFIIQTAEPLLVQENDLPIAWRLIAKK